MTTGCSWSHKAHVVFVVEMFVRSFVYYSSNCNHQCCCRGAARNTVAHYLAEAGLTNSWQALTLVDHTIRSEEEGG